MHITKRLTVSGKIIDDLHFLYSPYLYFLIFYNKNKRLSKFKKNENNFYNKYTIKIQGGKKLKVSEILELLQKSGRFLVVWSLGFSAFTAWLGFNHWLGN